MEKPNFLLLSKMPDVMVMFPTIHNENILWQVACRTVFSSLSLTTRLSFLNDIFCPSEAKQMTIFFSLKSGKLNIGYNRKDLNRCSCGILLQQAKIPMRECQIRLFAVSGSQIFAAFPDFHVARV